MLKAVDYNESDKILTLLTADFGKISAGIKGVKKAGAKLKFAAQPFCFAEYVLSKRGDRYTVINCSECESFYDLRTDIKKFYAACALSEAALALTFEGGDCSEILYKCVRTLTDMCTADEKLPLINFLLFALEKSGYAIAVDNCTECGAFLKNAEKMRFDFDSGAFTCFDCGNGAGVSRVTYNVLRKLAGKDFDESFVKSEGEKRALKLIKEYFSYKTDTSLKSLSEYIRLI